MTENIVEARCDASRVVAPLRLGVHGAQGKMGTRVCRLARLDARFALTASWVRGVVDNLSPSLSREPAPVDVIIDFTSAEGAVAAAELARRLRCAVLIGSTGLSVKNLDCIGKIAVECAVMLAPNTSRGVAAMNAVVAAVAQQLGEGFAVSISETHHIHKRDAPSGTALLLARTIGDSRGSDLPPQNIHSERRGEVIGEHEVVFAAGDEILRVSHSCLDRDVFARGALDAAAWLAQQPAGLYHIDDMLRQRRTHYDPRP